MPTASVPSLAPLVDGYIYKYRAALAESTAIRISRDTHARVTTLSAERNEMIYGAYTRNVTPPSCTVALMPG